MKILVYEHVSGGGFKGKPLPLSILSEGFGMLRTLIADFEAAGHNVTTVLDPRLAALNPPIKAESIASASIFRNVAEAIRKLSESADAVYIIAPESNNTLQSLVANVERGGAISLNCPSSIIGCLSNKNTICERAKELGLSTPATILISTNSETERIKSDVLNHLEFPLVVKPVDGVGCAGLSLVNDEQQLESASAKATGESSNSHFMVQEFIQGIAVSVSLFSKGDGVLPVSLNLQDVTLMPPEATSTFNGGQVPYNTNLKRDAYAAANELIKHFEGLKGYVGVDLILTKEEVVVLEANPRLTTSIVGVRNALRINSGQALIDSVLENKLPALCEDNAYAIFSKVQTPKPTFVALQKTYCGEEFVSPPFPVSDSESACALVSSRGSTLQEATAKFREAKNSLYRILG